MKGVNNLTLYEYDASLQIANFCGVDEAGRGPLAGDVYAAAVILDPDNIIEGINDSKKLSEKKREALFDEIIQKSISYSIGIATVSEIDDINILQATFLAMKRAVEGLSVKPKFALIDGDKNPNVSVPSRCLIKGDATSASIAAASILAKVARDRYMKTVSEEYPQYLFEKHKGYGTALHYEMLDKHGISPVHRKTFLKKYLEKRVPDTAVSGEKGEKLAVKHLQKNKYKVLETNFHGPEGEIDIIATNGDIIAFVEVKTRNENAIAPPREAVTFSKQNKIKKTAMRYMANSDLQPRFDIIEVILDKDKKPLKIEHIENAF